MSRQRTSELADNIAVDRVGVGKFPVHPVLLIEALQMAEIDGRVRYPVHGTIGIGEPAHGFELQGEDPLVEGRGLGGIVIPTPELDPRTFWIFGAEFMVRIIECA